MTTLETLKAARAKIADPEHWTRDGMAMAADGDFVRASDPRACRWCAMGAIMAVSYAVHERTAPYRLLDRIAGEQFTHFNDTHTHAEVLALFDKAIAEAK